MVTQAARSLIRPWQCGQYGSTDCFFTLRGQSRSCCVGRRPRLEARESSQDPGLAGRGGGGRLTGRDFKRKRARRKWVT